MSKAKKTKGKEVVVLANLRSGFHVFKEETRCVEIGERGGGENLYELSFKGLPNNDESVRDRLSKAAYNSLTAMALQYQPVPSKLELTFSYRQLGI